MKYITINGTNYTVYNLTFRKQEIAFIRFINKGLYRLFKNDKRLVWHFASFSLKTNFASPFAFSFLSRITESFSFSSLL